MSGISGITINNNVIPSSRELRVDTATKPADLLAQNDLPSGAPATRDSVKVDLSVEGLQASASAHNNEASSASNQAKEVEKIRERMKELQEKIQEQQAQLQAIQGDRSLSPDEKTQRISAISQQLASLNSSLASAAAQLMEALKGHSKMAGTDGVQPLPFVQHRQQGDSNGAS